MDKKKLKELISYLFFGVMTTIVNFIVYFIANKVLGEKLYLVSNVIAWVAAVAFAYVTNKLWVFESKSWAKEIVVKEAVSFVLARVFSLLIEEFGLWLLISVCGMDSVSINVFGFTITGNLIAKVITQFFVVVANYIFSKLFIFRKKEE